MAFEASEILRASMGGKGIRTVADAFGFGGRGTVSDFIGSTTFLTIPSSRSIKTEKNFGFDIRVETTAVHPSL
jgi:hypothetical protein